MFKATSEQQEGETAPKGILSKTFLAAAARVDSLPSSDSGPREHALTDATMRCPGCGFEQPAGRTDCKMCGLIFAKWRPPAPPAAPGAPNALRTGTQAPPPPAPPASFLRQKPADPFAPRRMDQAAWTNLAGGAVFAVLALLIPILSTVFHGFVTLMHEMGHAIAGWVLAHPSIPAFDLTYGGGVTAIMDRSAPLMLTVYALLAGLILLYRRNLVTVITLCVTIALYALVSHTVLRSVAISFFGHGFELIFGAVFLYRALSGSAVINPAERPLYAGIGLFVFFYDIVFAAKLVFSGNERYWYAMGKDGRGLHANDFLKIAQDLGMPQDAVAGVAFVFLLCCFAASGLAFLAFRYQARMWAILDLLVTREPQASA